jgi:hypothetical protein
MAVKGEVESYVNNQEEDLRQLRQSLKLITALLLATAYHQYIAIQRQLQDN